MDTRTTPPSGPDDQTGSHGGGSTLAFVIPWVGDDARGGAELQGWETARTLAALGYRTEVLTTCSRSFLHTWDDNYHRPGEETREGVLVRRFLTDHRDEGVFGSVNQVLLSGVAPSGEQEALFVEHNINSRSMYSFIEEHADRYVYVFLPYLYGTTLAGAMVRPDRSLLMPCFHDEAYAYMKVTRNLFSDVRGIIYLTPEEASSVRRIMPKSAHGKIVGGGIDTGTRGSAERFRSETGIESPFVLYIGRIDRGKNTHQLMAYFRHWADSRDKSRKLVLIGGGDLPVPADNSSVIRITVRDNQQKMDASAAAVALCQPSVNESFSRVIMESWLNEVPVLVSGHCPVTEGHCRRSGGGLYFKDYYEFAEILDRYFEDDALRKRLGSAGRRYVLENYHWDVIVRRLMDAVEELTGCAVARLGEGESKA